MTTSRDVIDMLRTHYVPRPDRPGGIFAAEIEAPGGGRRADLIWKGVTAGSGYELIGHEIKVDRRDLLIELEDPTKADAWQRYCDRWWIVVSEPELIDGLELPHTWGVMAPPSGRRTKAMTVLVKAPKLKPYPQAPALDRLTTWLHWKHFNTTQQVAHLERIDASQRDELQRLRRFAGGGTSARETDEERVVREIIQKLGGAFGDGSIGEYVRRVSIDDVVIALRDLGGVRHLQQRAEGQRDATLDTLRRLRTSIGNLLNSKQLQQAPQLPLDDYAGGR